VSYYVRLPLSWADLWLTINGNGYLGLTDNFDEAHEFDSRDEALAFFRGERFASFLSEGGAGGMKEGETAELMEFKVIAVTFDAPIVQLAEQSK